MTSPRSDSRRLGSAARVSSIGAVRVSANLGHHLGPVKGLEPAGVDVARVVDQNVDPTWFGQVSGHHLGLATRLSDTARQLIEGFTLLPNRTPRCRGSGRQDASR